jgi:hypothetical protein
LGKVPVSGFRSGVSAITEEVDVNVRDYVSFGSFEEFEEMVDMSVNTTVRDLSEVIYSVLDNYAAKRRSVRED